MELFVSTTVLNLKPDLKMKKLNLKNQNKWLLLSALVGLVPMTAAANPIGNDFQKLNPTANGIDYITVESSKTTETGKLNTGVLVDYSTNVLPVIEQDESDQSLTSVDDYILSSHFYASYGIYKNFEVGVHLPFILLQSTTEDEESDYKGEILSSGLTYMGVSAKYSIWSNSVYGVAAGVNLGTDLMTSNPYIGDTTPAYMTSYVALDANYDKIKFAVNGGYKYRSTGEAIFDEYSGGTPIDPVSSELLYSLGLNYEVDRRTSLTTELFGSVNLDSEYDDSDREPYSSELLGSFRLETPQGYNVDLGASTELIHGVGSADLRIFAGISYQFKVPSLGNGSSRSTKRSKRYERPTRKSTPSYSAPNYYEENDDAVYSNPAYDNAPSNQYLEESSKKSKKSQGVDYSDDPYTIEETELPTFDDPQDYSLD